MLVSKPWHDLVRATIRGHPWPVQNMFPRMENLSKGNSGGCLFPKSLEDFSDRFTERSQAMVSHEFLAGN